MSAKCWQFHSGLDVLDKMFDDDQIIWRGQGISKPSLLQMTKGLTHCGLAMPLGTTVSEWLKFFGQWTPRSM